MLRSLELRALVVCALAASIFGGMTCVPKPFVVLVVIDGLNTFTVLQDMLAQGDPRAAGFQWLIDAGASTLNARTDPDKTRTGPGVFNIVTGRYTYGLPGTKTVCGAGAVVPDHCWDFNDNEQGGVPILNGINDLACNASLTLPGCPRYIESIWSTAKDAGMATRMLASKGPGPPADSTRFLHQQLSWCPDLNPGGPGCDFDEVLITDLDFAPIEAIALNDAFPRLSLIHHHGPDTEGHIETFSEAYRDVIGEVSVFLLALRDAMLAHGGKGRMVVTADHGHAGGSQGCGGQTHSHTCITAPDNYTVPLFVWDDGHDYAPGADLYQLVAGVCDPGVAQVDQLGPCKPLRNKDAAYFVTEGLGLDPVPGSAAPGL